MQKSHVLISCQSGTEEYVSSQIIKMDDVRKVERTTGYYDLVVELEASDEEQLKKIMGYGIRNLKLIRSALLLVHS